ncbi:MAG: cbb3-type cytochrome oxidase assembly protein CcoS [Sulfurovum sp.]|nr:MAG: cbb3-type cytochrome oxidase assembly protein CcoS [Sulfurovum sp.]RUM76804.1 MAG: cbb3-type cytochrome oxidase assembly protein CcoS [Sulfurovum sp.]
MSENIVILMISISTILGSLGLFALIWAVKNGQFDDHNKFIDAVRHDNEEDLKDAAMIEEKKYAYQKKRKEKKNYMPPD